MRLSKEDEARYREQLRTTRDSITGVALEMLVKNEMERVKETLLDATSTDVPLLQGEGHGYRRILKFLKERPVATQAG